MGFEAVTRLVADLLTCTHDALPDEIVKGEIEKRMEDHRNELVIIAPGYPQEMARFLDSRVVALHHPDKSALMRIEAGDLEHAELGA
jgi:hypothetical protein